MRYLLAGILTLLPLAAQAESLVDTGADRAESPPLADLSDTTSRISLADVVGSSNNPYDPASPTNFETFIGPYLYVQGKTGVILYNPLSRGTADVTGGGRRGLLDDRYPTSLTIQRHDSRHFHQPF